jgi:hypothetical protein
MQNNNSYPLREWHVEHMKKTVIKFVTGLSPEASSWQKRQHKKYNKITNIRKGINYDIKHGVTNEEVISFMDEVRNNSSFHGLRNVDGSIDRLDEIEKEFTSSISPTRYQW